ncbi:uncharacterized protein LOC118420231 [Branchiostoma floridae]|uniref:Uncharacterized protein LOC118420231 n=1 Tax=Branchiostoma floridae TaxID=7739 RepID=A0A9J7LIS5_BRAFL|nr:uncharacterized protein LOC118420231 [Branchiostoma floridae]
MKQDWMGKVFSHPDKTKAMLFGSPQKLRHAGNTVTVTDGFNSFEQIHEEALKILPEWKLHANASKTERVHICLEKDREEEEWRKSKSVGSRLGIAEDIEERIQLANLAMRKMWKMWGTKHISLQLKLKLFEVYVIPVMLYNAGTWGLTEQLAYKIDTWHRKQLQRFTGHFHPNHISNSKLYSKCQASPLQNAVHRRRWFLFGHILRMPLDSPPQKILNVVFSKKLKPRLGRPREGLLSSLVDDCKLHLNQNIRLETHMLRYPRETAANRGLWEELYKDLDVH